MDCSIHIIYLKLVWFLPSVYVFFGPSMPQEYRKSTALCFSILTTAGILFDEACLADKKGSLLELGQFKKVLQVYIVLFVLHQQVPFSCRLMRSKIHAFQSRSIEWDSFIPKNRVVSNLYPDKLSMLKFTHVRWIDEW